MTQPTPTYIDRHKCVLPALTSAQQISVQQVTATCPVGGEVWVTTWQRDVGGGTQPRWVSYVPAGGTDPVAARLSALEAKDVTIRRALASVVALLIGGKTDLTVTWAVPFADAAYRIELAIPAALVGKVTAAVKSQTTTGAVITVTATAAVIAGSALDVTAYRYA